MTDWMIGDEIAEEINTTYDQEQPIGDTPSAYFGAGAEPIDAKNGSGFMDRGKLGESLNKDGTGLAKAVRGLDPTKTKRKWLRFVYVSKSDCAICKEFDGKIYHIDDENRPCIPRLEEWDGAHPITHPNCKCKWVRTFSDEDFGDQKKAKYDEDGNLVGMIGFESLDDIDPEDIELAKRVYGDDFDKADDLEKGWMVIKALLQKVSEESLFLNSVCKKCGGEDFDVMEKDGVIKGIKCKNCGDRPYGKESATEADNPYGIQNMLDKFIDKRVGKQGIEEVKDKIAAGFSLESIMELVAEKLASKLGKKLGVESKAQEYDIGECPICEGSGKDPNSSEDCEFCHGAGRFDMDNKTQGVEGGKGSGKTGHQPWMLGTYSSDECKNCMINTDRDKDGKCILCGN